MNRGFPDPANGAKRSAARPSTPPATASSPRIRFFRGAVFATALGLFAAAAAVGMVSQPDVTELPPARLVQSVMPLSADAVEVSSEAPAPYIRETRIRPGDTLAAVLQRLELNDDGLQSFLTHDPSARSIYKLYPGRAVQAATNDAGRLIWMRYLHTPGNEADGQIVTRFLRVDATAKGYAAREVTENTERQTRVAVGTIRSSLFAATDEAGVPDSITLQMADILSAKIDFLRNLRQGDQFRVVYEVRAHDGRYAGAGRVLALEFTNQGNTYNAIWFSPDGSDAGAYYGFDGTTLQGAFLRSALKFSRISSTFGMRMHPIHKTWTGHKGVDYAAPTGTPIHSTADGVVEFAGVQSGYGNVVIIKHDEKHSTLYGHQNRIAPGITKGARVKQGELIGYVGSTGWATGPHLHYEFRVDNQPIDPLSVEVPIVRKLEGDQAKAFAQAAATYRQQIDMLAKFQLAMPQALATVASN